MATKNRANVTRITVKGIRIKVDSDTGEVLDCSEWNRAYRFAHKDEHGFSISETIMREKEEEEEEDKPALIWEG